MMIIQYEQSRNDLFTEFQCTFPSKQWIGTNIEHLMKTRITFSGYCDHNFFYSVNAKPRKFKCGCVKKYTQQWFPNGTVEIEEDDE